MAWKLILGSFIFFLLGIHSMQFWAVTMKHGFARKTIAKRLKQKVPGDSRLQKPFKS